MKGLLAATIALFAGCDFPAPKAGPDAGVADAAVVIDAAPINPDCNGYDFQYNGHRYRLVMSAMTWMQAKAGCEADGGYLLKFDTQQEDDLAAQLITDQTEIWIGLHDPAQTGTYLWTDGTPPAFTRWATPPTAGSPDCVIKNTLVADGRWFTQTCTDLRPSSCECTPRP